MEICKLCGKEFIRMDVHVAKMHKMSMEAYNGMPSYIDKDKEPISEKIQEVIQNDSPDLDGFDEFENEEDLIKTVAAPEEKETKVSLKQRKDATWGGDSKGKLLQDFLDEFKMNETQLRSLIKDKIVKIPSIQEQINNKISNNRSIAESLKDKSNVEVTNVGVAEILTKEFGFKCDKVVSSKTSKSRTWVLIKQ